MASLRVDRKENEGVEKEADVRIRGMKGVEGGEERKKGSRGGNGERGIKREIKKRENENENEKEKKKLKGKGNGKRIRNRNGKGKRSKGIANALMLKGIGRKGVSPVVSTIIITAILLIILVVATFVSTNILEMQVTSTEFEQAKSNMLALNQVIQDVALRPGSGSYLQFNQRSGGIGVLPSQERVIIETSQVQIVQQKEILKPNEAGIYQNWSVFGGGDHYQVTSDSNNGTGVQVTGISGRGLVETENLENRDLSYNITSVTAHFLAKASGVSKEVFNPTENITIGSTRYLSGTLADLKSDDNLYMKFGSYGASTTENIVKNGNITTPSDWTYNDINDNNNAVDGGYSNNVYNSANYSLYVWLKANTVNNGSGEHYQPLNIKTVPTSANLCFYYRMDYNTTGNAKASINVKVVLVYPNNTEVVIFSPPSYGFSGSKDNSTGWLYKSINITDKITVTGNYTLKLQAEFWSENKKPDLYVYFDDIQLDIAFSKQVCEVEFTGISNNFNWINLTWTADLSYNASDVNTTIQLYNYSALAYANSGGGYNNTIVGTSDQTITQTVTTNATDFRDSNTQWKVKIKGEKVTSQPFELRVDLIKIEVFYEGDVKATIIWVVNGEPYQGSEFTISRAEFMDYSQTLNNIPNTNKDWNWTVINSLEIGANVTSLGEYETLQVSEFWVEVEYATTQFDKIYDSNWYGPLYSLVYRGGSRTAAADIVLAGMSSPTVGMSDQLGYVRVRVGDGVKIILDYNRVRVVTNSIVLVGNTRYNFTEISLIRLETGNLGGSGTINLKIQNMGVKTYTKVYDCNFTVLTIKVDHGGAIDEVGIKLESDPDVKTAIVLIETVIRVSMG